MNRPVQLPLQMRWPGHTRFADFRSAGNELLLDAVQRCAQAQGAPWLHLNGPPHSGKTHLLLAACQQAEDRARVAQYLSLAQGGVAHEQLWEQLEGVDLVCLDAVDDALREPATCSVLFAVYNRLMDRGGTLLLASRQKLASLDIALPDLRSRLAAMTHLTLSPLDEAAQRELVRQRAEDRGVLLSDAVLNYLFTRAPRQLPTLLALLEQLDRRSLQRQRPVSVPMLRELLEGGGD